MSAFSFKQPTTGKDYACEGTYAQTRLPLNRARSLIADAYRSPEFYALEQQQVFATSWVAVGFTEQLSAPGQTIVAEVASQSVVVTRDRHHRLKAFYNVCRHRGSQIVAADCQLKRFQCPYHGWQYSLEGDCVATPMFSQGKPFGKGEAGLFSVRVETWGFLVFVNLDVEAMPLCDWLGDLPQKLSAYRLEAWTLARQRDYPIRANWKLANENFMEYYHLPWVHPELVQVSRVEDHYRDQGDGMYTGMRTTPIAANTDAGGWQGLPPMAGLGELEQVSGRFIGLFPNVCLSLLPNHAFAILLKPGSADFTLESTAILLPPNKTDQIDEETAIDELMQFWDLVNQQDIEILEKVQKGLGNQAYQSGYLCDPYEEPLHRFQNMVIDRMVGIRDIVPAGDRAASPENGVSIERSVPVQIS